MSGFLRQVMFCWMIHWSNGQMLSKKSKYVTSIRMSFLSLMIAEHIRNMVNNELHFAIGHKDHMLLQCLY